MKKYAYLLVIIISAIATTGWCSGTTAYSASAIAVDGIMGYYSSMSKLEDNNSPASTENRYNDLYAYMKDYREKIITIVAKTKSYENLGRAEQMVCSLFHNENAYHSYSNSNPKATAREYFDSNTGHRYIKNGTDTYAEYTKKGAFLKTVPSDLPLLANGSCILPITEDNDILYKRNSCGNVEYITLHQHETHPKGWQADKILVSIK